MEVLYGKQENGKRFRHFYSDIFSVLTDLQQNPEKGDINILGQNLDYIRNGYDPNATASIEDVSDSINKLYDHVSLDIARISYSDAGDIKISGEEAISGVRLQISELGRKIEAFEVDLKKAQEKIDNSQKEYIAILGIFAAIVLAFTGGIAFSTSVLNNIANVSIYRIITIALLIGLVLINALYGLFYFISALVGKDKRLKPQIFANVVLIVLLVVMLIVWWNGGVEYRNRIINSGMTTETEVLETISTETSSGINSSE